MGDKYEENTKDTLFARWLSGNLSEEEKETLKSSGDDKILEKITATVDNWAMPELKHTGYSALKEKLAERSTVKIIPFYKNRTVLSIAASLLLILGLTISYTAFFATSIKEYQCEAGKKMDIVLPDQTHVLLNGYSYLSYDEKEWEISRVVALKGEGYFEVTKKGPFKVQFDRGEINVLGTRFSVMAGKDLATVKCYEGKVAVSNSTLAQQVLTAGMAIRLSGVSEIDRFNISNNEPDWKSGENIFTDAPLVEVINALSIQFNVPFEIDNAIRLDRKFTGKFVHSDLDTALKMVFAPMGINYTIEGEKRKTVILK